MLAAEAVGEWCVDHNNSELFFAIEMDDEGNLVDLDNVAHWPGEWSLFIGPYLQFPGWTQP